ncbi:MAG: hypothetical protein NT138_08525 [Planctomycetales bacterium]|nr:hypothetical protein [Planctomycetales bacterium]
MSQQKRLAMFVVSTVIAMLLLLGSESACIAQPPTATADAVGSEQVESPQAFIVRNSDNDEFLTEDEFLAGGGLNETILKRDFKVFDANKDGRMTVAEFLSVPAFNAEDNRIVISDPIIELVAAAFGKLMTNWQECDQDQDTLLSAEEFASGKINQSIRGIETITFDVWDDDGDGRISKDEAKQLLEVAFGLRTLTGELLRSPAGRVVDWRMFREMNPDEHGKIAKEIYVQRMGSIEAAEVWFPSISSFGESGFGVTEFSTSGHRTDPVNTFLSMDVNLDGQLSPTEMESLPEGWGPPGKNWLPGFDDEGDSAYSLKEFELLPQVNLLATWHGSLDINDDGVLSPAEFRFSTGVELAALSAEYFSRLDSNNDDVLTLQEWTFRTNHPEAKFRGLDLDSDGELTETEFIAEGSLPIDRLRRDYRVFDADANGHMTLMEFLSIPHWVAESLRTPIPDPVCMLSDARLSVLKTHWSEWDKDKDEMLSLIEFEAAAIGGQVAGLDATLFKDWDLNVDSKLTQDEVSLVLDIAFGSRAITGESLRTKSGYVPDWRSFRAWDSDADWKVTEEEYMRTSGGTPNAKELYRSFSKGEESFGISEFASGPYHSDPVGMFLSLDVNVDGRLTPDELTAIPADWGPPTNVWLPGFDDDGDGAYSLGEFMLIPHVNLLVAWHMAVDSNQDGSLSLEEFRFPQFPALTALSAEYFRRLDSNQDQSLSLKEWPFVSSHPDARFAALDTNEDGMLQIAEFLAEGSMPSDRLQRDFRVFDADGNGNLTIAEFKTISHGVPENLQTEILDPFVLQSQASWNDMVDHWQEWDTNRDESLSEAEFSAIPSSAKVAGMESFGFAEWDLAGDGQISREDASLALDVAYGIRTETGGVLRSKSGCIVDWGLFQSLDADKNGGVTLQEYKQILGSTPNAEENFRSIAANGDDSFGLEKFTYRTSPVPQFLALDADLDGRLSAEDLKLIPWGPPQKKWLPGFDDDGDGVYTLREFMRIPYINILTGWHAAIDVNHDGMLGREEFRFAPGIAYAAISAEYFRRLDFNGDDQLSLSEWPFVTTHPGAKFDALDANADSELTETEFLAEGSLPADRLRRDFKVFDGDANGRMTRVEFLSIPQWAPPEQRTKISDPVTLLSAEAFSVLAARWSELDTNSDDFMNAGEFRDAEVSRLIPGLEMTVLSDWDSDGDGNVSKAEAALLLDVAFGVRSPSGELLRSDIGHVVDWRGFLALKPDENGKVPRETYIKSMGTSFKHQEWFPTLFTTEQKLFGVTEYLTSNHKTDPISQFLHMDEDLDGLLSPAEMDRLPEGWSPPGKNWLPGFDDDSDGAYSLREFRLLPHVNLLANWHLAKDSNNDGKLSPVEFRFMSAPPLAALSRAYFERLDTDKDKSLTLKEWPFTFDFAKVPRKVVIEFLDRDSNGHLSFDECLGELRRTQPGDRVDLNQEAALAQREESFRAADANNDGKLSEEELATDEGLEAIAPGTSALSGKVAPAIVAPVSKMLGLEDASLGTYLIIEINFLLVVAVVVYLFRKRGQRQ